MGFTSWFGAASKRLGLCVLVCGFGPFVSAAPYGVNLLVNGNAESGLASATGAPGAVPNWTTSAAVSVVPYGAAGGFPTAGQGPPDAGNQFFVGGNSAATSTATQDIDVSANAADIDAGHVAVDVSGWFGGFSNQDDDATLTVNFLNNALAQIGSIATPAVTAGDRQAQTKLLNRGNSAFLPGGTRTLRVVLTMTRKTNVGTFNDGYADSLSVGLRGPGIVTNTNNTGPGSFRDLLPRTAYLTFDANVFGSGGAHEIVLTEPETIVSGAMTIVGPGANKVTISRYEGYSIGTSPIIEVLAPIGTTGPINISGLTLNVATQNNFAYAGILIFDTYAGTLTLRDSVIKGVRDHDGVDINSFFATFLAQNCTFVNLGVGILSQKATLQNCTFSGNRTAITGQGSGNTIIDSCTFSNNDNGIIFPAASPVPSVSVTNSIFNATQAQTNFDNRFANQGVAVTSNGFNLSTKDDSAVLKVTGDRNNSDPKLAPLGNYGGATQVHALLPGSLAIDKGNTALTTDQRGLARPVDDPNSVNGGGNNADIGAFELQAGEVVVPPRLGNISTRLPVQTGDNVLIGGFIITGTQPKKVIIRAIGPSLPFPGVLTNPTLELYSGSSLLESNDNWVDSANKQAIIDSTIPPGNSSEAAIVRTLAANGSAYTAIVRGANNTTGIAVVEAYDLDGAADSKLANISTRGFVQTGDNILIAGTIVLGAAPQNVIIRAIGPSLAVAGKLGDPTLELRDQNGALLEANDNWGDSPNKQAIIDSTIPPTNPSESAIVRVLPGNGASYTAIVRGVNNTTGIAVVEVYALN